MAIDEIYYRNEYGQLINIYLLICNLAGIGLIYRQHNELKRREIYRKNRHKEVKRRYQNAKKYFPKAVRRHNKKIN